MDPIRKVTASAGAEWVVNAFGLLKRHPATLLTLGLVYGIAVMVATSLQQIAPAAGVGLLLVLTLLQPFVVAGLVLACRDLEEGHAPTTAHLLEGFRRGKAGALLATFVPQVAAVIVAGVLLSVMVGMHDLERISAVMEGMRNNPNPPPDVFNGLPMGRVALWLLLCIGLMVAAGLCIFTAIPDIMLGDVPAMQAIRRSLRAAVKNLPALLVCLLLLIVAIIALMVGITIIAAIGKLLGGMVVATAISSLLQVAVILPLNAGIVYYAWKSMLGRDGAVQPGVMPPLPSTHFEA